jgi:hypothetical protein
MSRNTIGCIGVAVYAALTCSSFAESQKMNVDIASMTIGAAPRDFEFWRTGEGKVGQWAVVSDQSASNRRAIEQSDQDRTDYRFPLAIYKPVSATNVEAVVRFNAVSGQVDRAAGIAVRLTSPDSYYVVRANALEDNVRYRVVKGQREELEGANIKVTSNEWHTLALKAEGERFTVSFDGKTLFTANDKTIPIEAKSRCGPRPTALRASNRSS